MIIIFISINSQVIFIDEYNLIEYDTKLRKSNDKRTFCQFIKKMRYNFLTIPY